MIDRLFRGELDPCRADYRIDPNYTKAMEDILTAEEELNATLDLSMQKALSALIDAYARLGSSMAERSFRDGFSIALRLVFDVMKTQT